MPEGATDPAPAADDGAGHPPYRALLVDYGGVLTNPLHHTMGDFCRDLDVDAEHLEEAIRDLYGSDEAPGLVRGLETGGVEVAEFEVALAQRLRTRGGTSVEAAGLLTKMFAGFRADSLMHDVVRSARRHGVRTALVSNSWGIGDYPRHQWEGMFDAVVISGEVGMRKPHAEIYLLAAQRVDVPPAQCVFVDDIAHNVRGAEAAGMTAIHHVDTAQTIAELTRLFGVSLP